MKEKQEKKYLVLDGKQTRIEDLTGKIFNRLTIIKFDEDRYKRDLIRHKNGEIKLVIKYWLCKCNCGNKNLVSVSYSNLRSNHTTSCGCYNIECIKDRKDENLIGQKFNKLTVISRNEEREQLEYQKHNRFQKYWNCKCDCGSSKNVVVSTATIKSNATKSCGCLLYTATKDSARIKAKNGNSIMHYLINKYGKEIAFKMVDNDYNKQLNLYEINRANVDTKIHINCLEKDYHGEFEVVPSHLSEKKPTGCPLCSNAQGRVHPLDSLGYLDKNVHLIWSSKNNKTPYEYTLGSEKIVWWKCPDGIHKDYKRRISDYTRSKYDCPFCALERKESMLQKKVRLYLTEELGYELKHEWDCSIVPKNPRIKNGNNTLPFDNEVIKLKLIIEVHGRQHYEIDAYKTMWRNRNGLNPEEALHKRKLYDRYKKFIAYKNGYEYLEIPYWTEDDESYKTLINNKIKEIINKI